MEPRFRARGAAISFLAAGVALAGCRHAKGGVRGVCRVDTTVSISTEPGEVPTSLLSQGSDLFALTLAPRPSGVEARLVRIRDHRADRLRTVSAPRAEAVSELVGTHDGAAFAVATQTSVTAMFASGHPDQSFPRGEAPPGRDAIVPSIVLGEEPEGGLAVLANWGPEFGTRRLHTRDVGESAPLTPRRLDTFHRPALAIVGNDAVVVQQRWAGTFERAGDALTNLEVVALPASPDAAHEAEPVVVASDEHEVTGERIAALDLDAAESGVAIVWSGARGVRIVSAMPERVRGMPGFRPHGEPLTLDSAAATSPPVIPDVVAAPAHCGVLVGWIGGNRSFTVQRVAVDTAGSFVPGTSVHVPASPLDDPVEVHLARTGSRVVAVIDTGRSVRAFDVVLDATCAPSLRPIALPAAPPDVRVIGVAADASRALLAWGSRGEGHSDIAFVTFAPDGTLRAETRPVSLPTEVRAVAVLGRTTVLASRTRYGIELHEIDGGDDDLRVVDSHGDDFALAASDRHARIWVADAGGTGRTEFGPAQSVILHSVVALLQDGPRTEDWLGVVPYADFARTTFAATTLASPHGPLAAWAATFSAARESDGTCLRGAHLALFRRSDARPVPISLADDTAWQGAAALVPATMSTCADRVGSTVWNGSSFAIALRGPSAGSRWMVGDASQRAVRSVVLANDDEGVAPAIARFGDGYVAAWIAREAGRERVKVQTFRRDGAAIGAPLVMAVEPDAARMDRLAITAHDTDSIDVAYSALHGPVVAHVACSD